MFSPERVVLTYQHLETLLYLNGLSTSVRSAVLVYVEVNPLRASTGVKIYPFPLQMPDYNKWKIHPNVRCIELVHNFFQFGYTVMRCLSWVIALSQGHRLLWKRILATIRCVSDSWVSFDISLIIDSHVFRPVTINILPMLQSCSSLAG